MAGSSTALRQVLKVGGATIVSILALGWAFHDVDLGALAERLKRTSPLILALYACSQAATLMFRVVRWGLLVGPLGADRRTIFSSACLGIPATFFFPLRLGELVRPILVARSGVRFASSMGAVVVERIADGLLNLGLFFGLLAVLPGDVKLAPEIRGLSIGALVAFGGGLVFLAAAVFARGPMLALVARGLGAASPRLAARVVGLLGTFLDGLAVIGTLRRIFAFVALTLLYWGLNGASTFLLAESYAPGIPWISGPFTISVVVFAIMVPAGPAFAGTLEAGYRFGLGPFGVDGGTSAVIAISAHAIQLVLMGLFTGLGFLAVDAEGRRGLIGAVPDDAEKLGAPKSPGDVGPTS